MEPWQNYIPQLERADPAQFAIAWATVDGDVIAVGDADMPFSIQSISKVFTLAVVLGNQGEHLWNMVGREPSGDPFNSIAQLEYEKGLRRNPFINSDAIAVTESILERYAPKEALDQILQSIGFVGGEEDIAIDPAIALSEKETGFRNFALANFMRGFGTLQGAPERTLGVYFHHCAIVMTARQLALVGWFLAFDGCLSPGGARVIEACIANQINALMLTCRLCNGFRQGCVPGRPARKERRGWRYPGGRAGAGVYRLLVAGAEHAWQFAAGIPCLGIAGGSHRMVGLRAAMTATACTGPVGLLSAPKPDGCDRKA